MVFRTDINTLRAIAVACVVLFHYGLPVAGGGFVGVDVFFVISGYLMTQIIVSRMTSGQFNLLRFYYDRAARIMPALIAVCATILIVGLVLLDPAQLKKVGKDAVLAVSFLSNFGFWTESGYFDAASKSKLLLHTWSLSVEWQFYMVFPIALAAIARVIPGRRAALYGIVAMCMASFIAMLVLISMGSGRAISAVYFLLPARAWEMLLGGVVALLPAPNASKAVRLGMQWGGLASIIAACVLFDSSAAWPSGWALIPCLGAAVIIWNGFSSWGSVGPVQYFGRISYSLYLWHWPVYVAWAMFGGGSVVHPAIGGFFCLLISIGLAHLSFRYIEGPAQTYLRGRRLSVGAIRLAGVGCAVVLAGVLVNTLDGISSRVRGDFALYQDAVRASTDRAFPNERCGGMLASGELRLCELGRSNPGRDVLVVGDSFAEMWWPRAAVVSSANNGHALVFATKGGCPLLPGVERAQAGFECQRFYRAALSLAQSGRFERVVFIGQWSGYFKAGKPDVLSVTTGSGISVQDLGRIESAFRQDLVRLAGAGTQVVVVTTSPIPNRDVPRELRRRVFLGEAVERYQSFNWDEVRSKSLDIDGALTKLAAHGVRVINPAEYMCERSRCPLVENGLSLYSDGVHIRPGYAREVGVFLDQVFL